MSGSTRIDSRRNDRYQALRRLRREPPDPGRVCFEGERLVSDVLARGVQADILVVDADRVASDAWVLRCPNAEVVALKSDLFASLADTKSPQGILMWASLKPYVELDDLIGHALVLDRVADPGNVGALVRSAEAFGFVNLVVASDGASPYTAKAVRASMGSIAAVRCHKTASIADALSVMMNAGYNVIRLDPHGDAPWLCQPNAPVALVLGSEAHGLSDEVRALPGAACAIPMATSMESLNAAVAGSIAMYEVRRRLCRW